MVYSLPFVTMETPPRKSMASHPLTNRRLNYKNPLAQNMIMSFLGNSKNSFYYLKTLNVFGGDHPGVAITPRGLAIRFKESGGQNQGLVIEDYHFLNRSADWSFFMYFYANDPWTNKNTVAFSKFQHIHFRYDASNVAHVQNIAINDNNDWDSTQLDLRSSLSGSDYYVVAGSSFHDEDRVDIYTQGQLFDTLTRAPDFAWNWTTQLSLGRGNASNWGGMFWQGDLIAWYEWDRGLTASDHRELYRDPFQMFMPE